jgi:hypothetical protein
MTSFMHCSFRECVYLRQEQNIPEGYGTKFQPIQAAPTSETSGGSNSSASSGGVLNPASEDIVLTLRSVQV